MHLRMFHGRAATKRLASLSVQFRRAAADRIAGLLKSTGRFGRPSADRIRVVRHASARLKMGGTAADGVEIVMNVNRLARAREQ